MSRHALVLTLAVCAVFISFPFPGLATAQPEPQASPDTTQRPRPIYFSANTRLPSDARYFHLAELPEEPVPGNNTPAPENESGRTAKLELGTDYFKGFLRDTYYILSSPARWDRKDWITASLVLATTGAFIAADGDIQKFAQRNRTGTTDDIARAAEPFGNGAYLIAEIGIGYMVGSVTKNEKLKRVSLLSLESFSVTGMLVFGLKYLAGRDRPTQNDGPYEWDGPNTHDVSFSSGHTAAAFAVATTLAEEYKDSVWIPPLSYGIATLTGLSRINDNEHWASDVFMGAAIGYFTAKTIARLHSNPESSRLIIYPGSNSGVTTLNFTYFF